MKPDTDGTIFLSAPAIGCLIFPEPEYYMCECLGPSAGQNHGRLSEKMMFGRDRPGKGGKE